MSNQHQNKSREQLEKELEHERQKFNRDAHRLESQITGKMDFGQHAMDYITNNGAELADNFVTTIKENPVPTLLTAVGVLWMMSSSKQQKARYAEPADRYDELYYGDNYSDNYEGLDADSSTDSSSLKEGVSRKLNQAEQKLRNASESAKSGMDSAKAGAGNAAASAGSAKDRAGRATRQQYRNASAKAGYYKSEVAHYYQDNPWMIAVSGLAVGAAIGAAIPETDAEHKALGDYGNKATDTVKKHAEDAKNQASDKAGEAIDKARTSSNSKIESKDTDKDAALTT